MADTSDFSMGSVVRYLIELIGENFGDEVASIYFGDVGVYPPQAFKDRLGNDRVAVSVQVQYNRKTDNRTHAGEERKLGVNIVPMVNMVPFFEALPEEAYGEPMLVEFTERLYRFFARSENIDLYGRVSSSEVGDIDLSWTQRDTMSIRAAMIPLELTVFIDNLA